MELSPITQNSITPAASTRQISSDFETFLKMLTTQAENQDPLNPIDSSDYAVQLATFSGVEQQVQTNDLLKALTGQFGASGIAQLADWVGKEARTSAPVAFSNTAITLYPAIQAGAETAVLIVRDRNGTEIDQVAIPTDGEPITWAGVTTDGFPVPSGLYTFDVQSFSGGDFLGSAMAETYRTVTEIRRDATGGTIIVLAGETEVAADNVTALRART